MSLNAKCHVFVCEPNLYQVRVLMASQRHPTTEVYRFNLQTSEKQLVWTGEVSDDKEYSQEDPPAGAAAISTLLKSLKQVIAVSPATLPAELRCFAAEVSVVRSISGRKVWPHG